MSGYLGPQPVPQATQHRQTVTATAGLTSITTSGYQPGYVDVYMNGVKLVDGTDYTATDGASITLASAANANDIIEIIANVPFQLVGMTFTGTTTFNGPVNMPTWTTAGRPSSPQIGTIGYNTTTAALENYTSSGWQKVNIQPPLITSVSPTTYNGEQGTSFTILGSDFESDAVVKFVTAQGVEYAAATVTHTSASSITATTPQDFTVANEPLSVKVINGSGLSAVLSSAIDCGGTPSWSTASGSIGTCYDLMRDGFTASVSATDPDAGATVSYSLVSGSLPTGMSLNAATGLISGTPSAVLSDTTYSFTLRASDNAGNTSDRNFSITIKAPVVTVYSYTGSDQALTVPSQLTKVQVYMWGGGGGGSRANGGGGGYTEGTIDTSTQKQFAVMVGGGGNSMGANAGYSGNAYGFGGGSGYNGFGGGGGGLSGVFTGTASVSSSDHSRAVLIAGGGGAGDWDRYAGGGAGGGLNGQSGSYGGGGQTFGASMYGGRAGGGDEGGGGGGGGGYNGGSAGNGDTGGSGGGGSGYIGSGLVSNGITTAGSGTVPPQTSSPYYANSAGYANGYSGRVVIVY